MPALLRNRWVLTGLVVLAVVAAAVVIYERRPIKTVIEKLERSAWNESSEIGVAEAERDEQEAQRRREAQREQVRLAKLGEQEEEEEAEREALAQAERQRLEEEAERAAQVRRAENARTERERRRAEQERLADERRRAAAAHAKQEEERRLAAELQAQRDAEERAEREKEEAIAAEQTAKATAEEVPEADLDDTPESETETSIDDVREGRGWAVDGDLRPILQYEDEADRDGTTTADGSLGARFRLRATWGITEKVRIVGRLAGLCFTDDCDLEFVSDRSSSNGLDGGQFTLDELFVHWFRRARFDLAFGRLQTRFVLRGGVYAKSLDRNDSNNVNVTWTDGLQGTLRAKRGWTSSLVVQRNAADGTGSIRRGPLDFDDSAARNTYFLGTENIRAWGPVAQRGFDLSYLPSSLLKDGDPAGRREDYWGLVARIAFRWPQRREGLRLRAGAEVGYAPETPTVEAMRLPGTGDVDGLAWDVVISAMGIAPGHNLGINYGRTGAGWLLSPQFQPNDELFEVRYQWEPQRFPLLEARVRWREDLELPVGALQKRETFDFYLRLTWQFDIKDY